VLIIGFALILWGVVQLKRHEPQLANAPVSEEPSQEPALVEETTPTKDSDPGHGSGPNLRAETVAKPRPTVTALAGNTRATGPESAIDSSLIARDLIMPAAIEIFDKPPSLTVRGSAPQVESFAVISPFCTLVSDEPTFRWTALPGTTSYVVAVYDSNLRLVTTSQPLTETHWSAPDLLQRGMVYTWTVVAAKDGKEIIAPALPTRAEFTVIGASQLIGLNRRIKRTVSHAARGVIYAEAGLLDDAEREFRSHLAIDPADDRARKLLETVQSWRKLP
jgi:hypothetical protein